MLASDFIINYFFYYLLIVFSIFFCLLVYNFNFLVRSFKKVKKTTWIILFLIFLFAFSLRMWFVPHMFQIYNDEYAHKDVAQNMFFYQSACECHGIINETGCSVCIVPAWSPVYHFLLSFSFSFSDGFDFLFF